MLKFLTISRVEVQFTEELQELWSGHKGGGGHASLEMEAASDFRLHL